MEEEYANKRDFDPAAINSVKVSLMGPLAGIGDAFFQGVLRIVASAIGVGMVNASIEGGNPSLLGVLVALVLFNAISLYLRIKGLYLGFDLGRSFMQRVSEENVMQKISVLGSIVGMMVVGGMVASMIGVSTSLEFATNSGAINVQALLDSVAPKLLPLGVFALMYYFIKKKVNITVLLLGTLVTGILLTWLGVFSF
jgi:mannose/fructose/N-acetylgalactosamine-specific phosphotransferase system component IID